MAPTFTFPPPPPPPPPAAPGVASTPGQSQQHQEGQFQRRGRGRSGVAHNSRGSGARQRFDWDRPVQHSSRTFQYGPQNRPAYQGAQKRSYQQAFTAKAKTVPTITAPPAVPSFGDPIPAACATVPQALSTTSAKVKKDRTFNQLGLTPRTEEHESSEEDDDEDEEAKLGATSLSQGHNGLHFEHKGQLMSLRTPDEIRVWIAERRKRYPTKARIAEAAATKIKLTERQSNRPTKPPPRAKQATRNAKKSGHHDSLTGHVKRAQGTRAGDASLKRRAETIASDAKTSSRGRKEGVGSNLGDISDEMFETSSESEETSSSGESESTDDSEDAPEEQSIHLPVAALPLTPQEARHSLRSRLDCQRLKKTGRCRKRGCPYRHDSKSTLDAAIQNEQHRSRVPLYQRLLARQHEEDDRDLLGYISAIGERGLLKAGN